MSESINEVRYDLEVLYADVSLDDLSGLLVLASTWQARNSKLRVERLELEAQGPRELA
jgi:hypothetical protein